jgi:hypothetical protein
MKLLVKFQKSKKLIDDTRINEDFLKRAGYRVGGVRQVSKEEYDPENSGEWINPRLKAERDHSEQVNEAKKKISVTRRVFKEEQLYSRKANAQRVQEL